jgi:dienelactone hydrolase
MRISRAFFVFLFLSTFFVSYAQKTISFVAKDGLVVSADLYLKSDSLPFIILLHQAEYSRGEYKDIAKRLLHLNYNCLAVDLRYGNRVNYITNQTAERAQQLLYSQKPLDAELDIQAAIDYIYRKYSKPIVLFGSSYSASLALVMARKSYKVKAAIAFSPGEYFRPDLIVKQEISDLNKPVFITCTKLETPYVKEISAVIPSENKYEFYPTKQDGTHGAKVLWDDNPDSDKFWFELLIFFKYLQSV